MSKEKHEMAIPVYVENFKAGNSRRFKTIKQGDFAESILRGYYLEGKTVKMLSEETGISAGSITNFIQDYRLRNYDDSTIEDLALIDADNHLGVMTAFFSSVFFMARENAMASVFARKVRAELADHISRHGALDTAKNKDLMRAWDRVTDKTEKYGKLSVLYMERYIKLMEQVLDKQREMAFVKVLFDIVRKLEPEVAEQLNKALQEDPYARSVLESMSGEALLKTFMSRQRETADNLFGDRQLEESVGNGLIDEDEF